MELKRVTNRTCPANRQDEETMLATNIECGSGNAVIKGKDDRKPSDWHLGKRGKVGHGDAIVSAHAFLSDGSCGNRLACFRDARPQSVSSWLSL
jgi:hypothetical protein